MAGDGSTSRASRAYSGLNVAYPDREREVAPSFSPRRDLRAPDTLHVAHVLILLFGARQIAAVVIQCPRLRNPALRISISRVVNKHLRAPNGRWRWCSPRE